MHKELANKEGQKYNAWLQLDFKNTDKYGNFETKQFHQQYGYNLQTVLEARPIKELANNNTRNQLMESLQRGNRQMVTFESNGKEIKAFIEAAPQYKSLNYYNDHHKRIDYQTITTDYSQEKKQTREKYCPKAGTTAGRRRTTNAKQKKR